MGPDDNTACFGDADTPILVISGAEEIPLSSACALWFLDGWDARR
jgi:hypothetical protein